MIQGLSLQSPRLWRVAQYVSCKLRTSQRRSGLTKRALDAGDSAAFSSIFLVSSFSCSQAESTPAPAPVTQTVGQLAFILCKETND